jgi:uncharacterized protein
VRVDWGFSNDPVFWEKTMSQDFRADSPYASFGTTAINAPADVRMAFIRKTYAHLAAAIYAFVLIEFALFRLTNFPEWALQNLTGGWTWLVVLGAFAFVGWVAQNWALSATSLGKQYAGLFLYVLAQAVIFVPILAIANGQTTSLMGHEVQIIPAAGLTTVLMFTALSAYVFLTKQDFSFLGGILTVCVVGAFALILASVFFGMNLGVWFSALMIVVASGYVLYYTSGVLHQYRTDQYVAAALALFAAIALLFWYVLRIMLELSRRR